MADEEPGEGLLVLLEITAIMMLFAAAWLRWVTRLYGGRNA